MADLQALIDAGISPLDAASLVADLQRYETSGFPNLGYGIAPQATMQNGVRYEDQYGGMDIIPGMTRNVFSNLNIPMEQLPVYDLLQAQALKDPNNASRMSWMPQPGETYRIYDPATGKSVMTASTPEEYAQLASAANELSKTLGRNANFQIQRQDPQSIGSGWTQMYSDTPDQSFGDFADVLGDALLGTLVGGPIGGMLAAGASTAGVNVSDIAYPILGAMTPLGPIAGAAAGTAASGAIQGRSLEDILLRSAITAGTAGLMKGTDIGKSISGKVGNALSDIGFKPIVGDVVKQIVGDALPQEAGEIVVNALVRDLGANVASGAIGSGVGSALNSLVPQIPTPAPPPAAPPPAADDLVVTAQPGALNNLGGSTFGSIAGSSIGNPMTGGGTNPVTGEQYDIDVTAQPNTGVLNGLPSSLTSGAAQTTLPEVGPIDTVKEPGLLEKVKNSLGVSDYLKIASLGAGLLGGGGGGGSGTRYTGVGGGLSPNFSAKLPTPSMPGASSNFAVRPASEITTVNGQPRDWTKYGFGPEASFFSYVPQRGYAYGGDVSHDEPSRSFAVRGPGDGRSDDIPAMLSDGEYVMDAETVALLGNGSPKAGAEVLDQFRVNLRKHKGQKLAKGEFSANAKKPEHYLAGGRI